MRVINMNKLMAAIITTALALAGIPLLAQSNTSNSPGVARVSLIRGDVSMERGDSNEWVAVTVNTPLVPGDTIATGAGSRAEVQLDYSNVVRLDGNAVVKIADLNSSRIQLQVAQGIVDLAVLQGNEASSEVDTPNVAVEPLREGTYRIDVRSNALSLVTVRDGQSQISTPQGSATIDAGQQITVEGEQNPQYQIVSARPLDNWDRWNRERNRVIDSASNYNHVNRYYTGAQDLDTYGRWVYVPNYDWCWTPYVNAGWVPYSYGRWAWQPYYGWTWVSYNPWGWAPYHYGRWFFWNNAWCWWPGAVTPYYRPLWAPAYVSFFGFGYGYHHFSFGFGYGFRSIGWCPLGPHDRFHRWWGHDRDHSFNVVNINHYYGRGGLDRGGRGYRGSNLALVRSNFHVRRAIVTMPANRFGRAAVPRNRQVVSATMLRGADVVHGTLPVVPTRASLRFTNRSAIVPAVARSRANNTHFFSRRTAARPNFSRSFNTQAASIRHMVENRNIRAPGVNRPAGNVGGNRGFRISGQRGAPVRGFSQRQNGAPVVRENPRGLQNRNTVNRQGNNAGQARFRHFGTGAPSSQLRGNRGRQNSAPVVRENPRGRSVQPGFHRFSGNTQRSPRVAPNRGSRNPGNNLRRFTPQTGRQSVPRNEGRFNSPRTAPQDNRAGWTRFQPQARTPQQRGGFYNRGAQTQRYYQPRYQSQPRFNAPRTYSRPPLRLNRPIVSEPRVRSYGGNRGGSAPRFRSAPRPSFHGGSRGGFHASRPAPSRGGRGGGGHRR